MKIKKYYKEKKEISRRKTSTKTKLKGNDDIKSKVKKVVKKKIIDVEKGKKIRVNRRNIHLMKD